ncbi:MAG: DUF3793 family protein [Firmicutes bacterium]|nr:DUF3793 family protein [Bacillota bacterium]
MSEDLIIRHCAPTLAGLKTGNIFNASYESEDELKRSLAAWNRILERRGLKATCLRTTPGRALIYVYRPQLLEKDLTGPEASEVLEGFGYVPNDPDSCIEHLASRIAPGSGFPHEIGLFLGYPPEDVKGFMRYGGKCCKTCGYWKVYGDAEAAEKRFAQFSKCTGVYLKCMACGAGLEKLAVRKS